MTARSTLALAVTLAATQTVANPPETVRDLVLARASDGHPALRFEDSIWSWAELVTEARRRAALFADMREPGAFHVGVLLDNVPEFVFSLAGAALCGAVVVGINPTRRGENLAHDITHTDCQMIVTDTEHLSLLDGLDVGVELERILVVDQPEFEARLPVESRAGPTESVSPEDLYLLLFTSGSSGAPKAVRMTHGRATRASDSLLCGRDDLPYCAMPLHHGNALNAILFPAMGAGATVALKRRFSASDFIGDVRELGCTYASTIGRVLTYILATPERSDDSDNDLKLLLGPESSAADSAEFRRRFGCPVFAGYGSSENAIVLQPPPRQNPAALGVAAGGDDIAVVDSETGEECETARFSDAGELLNASAAIGELVNRDPGDRFEGYYNNPEAEAVRRRNGWYWSGDLAYRDSSGLFWFAGRTADWIRVDGENFAAAPVERLLIRHESIRGACVYGVPDGRNAEDQVMAALELIEGAEFDPQGFDEFLSGQPDLGTKWVPRYVRIVDQLPVTGNNKVDKEPLRSQRWACDDAVWWRPDRRHGSFQPLTASDVLQLDAELLTYRGLT
ncbi:MAG: AMP-binding protein [Microthrixaceae bacterium]